MSTKIIYSLIASPLFPDLSELSQQIDFEEFRFDSTRKAISHLKKTPPDIVLGEFMYGYGNNYAGVNVSNLDVFLYSLQKYAPDARVIVLVDKEERQYVEKLAELFILSDILKLPVAKETLIEVLDK